jgi:long-chain acyl-CoA synthetase
MANVKAVDPTDRHKVWLASYPETVPAQIDTSRYQSLSDLFRACTETYADRPAFENFGTTLSYAEFAQQSRAFATYLQQTLKLNKGDRVAVMLPNILQNPIAVFGILLAGMVVVNTNPLYTPRELEHQLKDSGAVAIVVVANCAHVLEKVLAHTAVKHIVLTQVGDLLRFPKSLLVNLVVKYAKKAVPSYSLPGAVPFKTAVAIGAGLVLAPVALSHNDIAFLQYTGGTTGTAKGAVLTHGNMVANTLQAAAWVGVFLKPGQETMVTALPLYHIFALTINGLVFLHLGALNRLITDPRNMQGFVAELRKGTFTCMTGVNTLFNRLLHTEGFDRLDFSNLRLTLGGGMSVQQSVAEHWQRVTGSTLIEGYGLTETSPLVTANPLTNKHFTGSIGVPMPSTDCCIRDEAGNDVPIGTVGELCFRGPQIMQGYWQRPMETAQVLDQSGWLRTGDMAQMNEDGYIKLVDRKKDIIKVSGFSVFPNELEATVAAHPGVLEVAAIGYPDAESGEVVKLFVVKKDPNLTAEDLRQYCRENMVPYKVPRHIEFRADLPKSNVGKILRRELRETADPAAHG